MTLTKFLLASASLLFLVSQPVFSVYGEDGPSRKLQRQRADSEGWILEKEYFENGRVFPQRMVARKESNPDGHVKHSLQKPDELTCGTLEFITPEALLHFNYYEVRSAGNSVKSFTVTPNLTGLTADSAQSKSALSSVLTDPVYASIPVPLKARDRNLDLLVFGEDSKTGEADYPVTIAAALHTVVTVFIPKVRRAGNLPTLQTVTISDGHEGVLNVLRGMFPQESYTLTTEGPNNYWEMIVPLSSILALSSVDNDDEE